MSNVLLSVLARLLPPLSFARLHCRGKLGYWPNLAEPRTFAERMLVKRLTDFDPLIPLTADKFTLRSYVEQKVGTSYLPELYAVVESADDVDVTKLPADYVMKGTHGSGFNQLVSGAELSNEEARALAASWLRTNYYWKRREWAYRNLTPRVIFEENLAPGGEIADYKFFVFGGVVRMIQVDEGRFSDHHRSLLTPEWERLKVDYVYPAVESVTKPQDLPGMLQVAETLAAPFAFARVDLYAVGARIVVGEITHYPDGGVSRLRPPEFERELGDVWGQNRPISKAFVET